MTTWHHSRKGLITGEVVGEDETWLHIRLTGDQRLKYASQSNRGRIDEDGEVITARKSFLIEITEPQS